MFNGDVGVEPPAHRKPHNTTSVSVVYKCAIGWFWVATMIPCHKTLFKYFNKKKDFILKKIQYLKMCDYDVENTEDENFYSIKEFEDELQKIIVFEKAGFV